MAKPELSPVSPASVAPGGHVGTPDLYPDASLTKGHADPAMTEAQVCQPGYAQKDRIVNESIRRRVFDAYHIPESERYDADGKPAFEIDHFIPVVLGGDSPDDGSVPITANLWPQRYMPHPGARDKD
ncbi:MAG: hypothetical protein ACREJM_14640, partial [Candidatus Saccharimonadales bacterium]